MQGANNTAIMACIWIGQKEGNRKLSQDSNMLQLSNYQNLNITKTREMMVDFKRLWPHSKPVIIRGVYVECCSYLHGPGRAVEC